MFFYFRWSHWFLFSVFCQWIILFAVSGACSFLKSAIFIWSSVRITRYFVFNIFYFSFNLVFDTCHYYMLFFKLLIGVVTIVSELGARTYYTTIRSDLNDLS